MTNKDENTGLEVAVIGLSGRFPGSANVDELWKNLKEGKELITFFSDDELRECGITDEQLRNPNYVKAKGFLEDAECFDARFFEYTNKEADYMDPQLRIFHECAYHALEDAGYSSEKYQGSIGLFGGAGFNPFWIANFLPSLKNYSELFEVTGLNGRDYLATRVAYKLGLRGPALTVQTACSTSVVAIHLACQSLLAGECEMALAGGVTVLFPEIGLPRKYGMVHEKGLVIPHDGHCRPFDKEANGFMGGDGVGIVALKRLEDAIADGDNIYAVIKGSAINNDGKAKAGYTAPSVEGQSRVIRAALEVANVGPESIHYVETHGSGTPLGDAIEVEGLKSVFNVPNGHHCALGSIKSNMGHTDAAAGVAGFIKTVLAVKNGQIPPTINHNETNPNIDFDNSPFYVNTALKNWDKNGLPRRAGVSSFGIGGSNAHLIIEEAPLVATAVDDDSESLILLSAKTQSALKNICSNLVDFLKQRKQDLNLKDLAYTLQVGRGTFEFKRSLICSSIDDLIAQLSSEKNSEKFIRCKPGDSRTTVFVFSGLGGQYPNMGLDLYKKEAVFKEHMDHVFEIVRELIDLDLKSIVYPAHSDQDLIEDLHSFDIAQLSVFAFEYAMSKLLMDRGVSPDALIGYSFGEYTAACISEVLTVTDTLRLIIKRGELILTCEEGAMLSIPLRKEDLLRRLEKGLELAIDNGESCVVSGSKEGIEFLEAKLRGERILSMRLQAGRAIHSSMMESCLSEFETFLKTLSFTTSNIPIVSNGSGDWVDRGIQEPGYWVQHLSKTVEFATGVRTLLELSNPIFIEIGPGSDISTMLQKFVDDHPQSFTLNTCRPEGINITDTKLFLSRLQKLWQYGIDIDWSKLYGQEQRKRISLPGYAFDKHRFWFKDAGQTDSSLLPAVETEVKKEIVKSDDPSEWFYVSSWEQDHTSISYDEFNSISNWLVLTDNSPLAESLIEELKRNHQSVVVVDRGETFGKVKKNNYSINPLQKDHYSDLTNDLIKDNFIPDKVIHLWSREKRSLQDLNDLNVKEILSNGFNSLMGLSKAFQDFDVSGQLHKFFVFTDSLYSIIGEETLSPIQANVLGACKAIPLEFSHIQCTNIDVNSDNLQSCKRIMQQLRADEHHNVIALRAKNTWVQSYSKCHLNKDQISLSKAFDGAKNYLIIGSLDSSHDLGLNISKYLSEKANVNLVFFDQTKYPARSEWKGILTNDQPHDLKDRLQQILDLEERCGSLHLENVDLANFDEFQGTIRRIEKHLGAINGIVNVPQLENGFTNLGIDTTGSDDLRTTSDRKVKGILHLHKLFHNKHLDFCLLNSSLPSTVGLLPEAMMCNAFQNALAHMIAQGDRDVWISVDWNLLFGVDQNGRNKKDAISDRAIHEILDRVLSDQRFDQITLSPTDFYQRIEQNLRQKNTKDNHRLNTRNGLSRWYYKPSWIPIGGLSLDSTGKMNGCIVFANEARLSKALLRTLENTADQLIVVSQGSLFEKQDSQYFIDPSDPEHYVQLFLAIGEENVSISHVFHLWACEDEILTVGLENIDQDQTSGFYSLIHIAKSIHTIQTTNDITLSVITNNMQSVSGKEELCPQKATVLGPVKVIPYENPKLKCISMDVDVMEQMILRDDQLEKLTTTMVNDSMQMINDFKLIAYRDNVSYENEYQQVALPSPDTELEVYQEKGIYLLTGGLGGVAQEIVKHISSHVRATFILLDYHNFPTPERWDEILIEKDDAHDLKSSIYFLRSIEAQGSAIRIYQADICDEMAMKHVTQRVVSEYGRINGVFHTAGRIDNAGMIQTRSLEETHKVMAPKLTGALVLDQALKGCDVDFVMYFSSLNNTFARLNFGQVAYGASNEFVEAFAQYRRNGGQRAFVINSNAWKNTGMSARFAKKQEFKLKDRTFSFDKFLSAQPREILSSITNILANDECQVAISSYDLFQVREFINDIKFAELSSESKTDSETPAKGARPELSTEYVAAESRLQMDLIEIFKEIFRYDEIGIDDDFFELGGDSLKAISATSILQHKHGLDLSVADFFKARTVRRICPYLDADVAIGSSSTTEEVSDSLDENLYEPFSITPIQLSYLIGRGEHFQMGGISTAVYQEGEVEVDIKLLNETFDIILRRHPMLRAMFLPDGTQKFLKVDHYQIKNENLSHLSPQEQQQRIQTRREAIKAHVFDESKWPLFEISSYTLTEGKHCLFFSLDHMICDAASILIFIKEWDFLLRNPDAALPRLGYTFKDYMHDYENMKSSAKYEGSRKYWLDKLDDFPMAPNIPLKCDPSSVKRPKFKRQSRLLSKEDWHALQQVAKASNTTPSVMLSAAYAKVLSVWSNRGNIAINVTLLNRYPFHEDVQNIVGDFTMLLMLGLDFSGGKSFLQEVSMVQQTLLESLDHRAYDGVEFIREFRNRHNLGMQVAMPYVFTGGLYGEELTGPEEVKILNFWRDQRDAGKAGSQSAQVYLDCIISEMNGRLELVWDYVEDIFDEAVISAMFAQFLSLVEDTISGKDVTEIHVEKEFADLVRKNNGHLGSNGTPLKLDLEKEYWPDQFKDGVPSLQLPTDFVRKPQRAVNLDQLQFEIDRPLVQRLQGITSKYETKMDVLLASVFLIFLSKVAGQDKVIIGLSTSASPTHRASKTSIYGNNIFPHIGVPGSDKSFRKFLKETEERMQSDLKHQSDPMQTPLHGQDLEFDPDKTSLFDVLFMMHKVDSSGVESAALALNHSTISAELSFTLIEDNEGIDVTIDYDSNLFSKNKIATFFSHYLTVIDSIVTQEDPIISDIEILPEADRTRILRDFNDTKVDYDGHKLMHQLFEEQAAKKPDNIALIYNGNEITYEELNQRSNQLAHKLRELGCKVNSNVSVIQSRTDHLIVTLLGILKAGGAYVPLEPYSPDKRILRIVNAVCSEIIIIGNDQMEMINNILPELNSLKNIIIIDKKEQAVGSFDGLGINMFSLKDIEQYEDTDPDPIANSSDNAYIIFTSGTTGDPKGVVVQHSPVINLIEWVTSTYDFSDEDRILFTTSVSFDLSVFDIFGLLAAGGSIFILSSIDVQDPAVMARALVNNRITFWDSAPQAFQQVISYMQHDLPEGDYGSLRLSFLSGDWVPLQLPGSIRSFFDGCSVVALGGATEATVWSNYYNVTDIKDDWVSIPYGKPIQNAKYYILDENLKPCPIGTPGYLYIGGNCLAKEYYGDDVLSKRKFLENPFSQGEKVYFTGDRARWFEDGNIEFLGRLDDQVKIRGFRVELGEIESHLSTHKLIRECVAVAKKHEGNNYLVAYIVAESEIDSKELKEMLLQHLPDYMVPVHYIFLEQLPLTSNGKLDKKALPEPQIEMKSDHIAPSSSVEVGLAQIWAELLNLDENVISIDDSFFEVGGHSLKATILINKINQQFKVRIPLTEVFSKDTIRQQAEFIETTDWLNVDHEQVEDSGKKEIVI